MLKKLLVTSVGVTIVIGAIVYAKLGQFAAMGEAAAGMVMPPETVTAVTVADAQWDEVIAATGTVTAVQGVTVSVEVGGRVTQIAFESGAVVDAGELLLQLDTASEDAQLASAEAAAALAKTDLARVRKLGKRELASEDAVDRAAAQVKETVAQVGRLRQGMKVRVSADAAPGETVRGEIVALSPEVDATTRNLRVRAIGRLGIRRRLSQLPEMGSPFCRPLSIGN